MKKGSITIFSLLSMILVAALLCMLLEGARYHELKRLAQLQTHSTLESLFAGYSSCLWEEYHLLAVDKGSMEDLFYTLGNGRNAEKTKGLNVLGFEVTDVEIKGYTLLTDAGGLAYIQAVSTYMEKNFLYEMAISMYEQYEQIKELLENCEWDTATITEALKEMEESKEIIPETNPLLEDSGSDIQKGNSKMQNVEDLLLKMQTALDKGILALVLPAEKNISYKEIDLSQSLFARSLLEGKTSQLEEVDWLDRILLQQYFLNYMSNYQNQDAERALIYELEYLLGGESSDVENLKETVTQMLALRGAANFTYLMSDTAKVQEVTLLVTALTGISLNPILLELIKTALLTAWALAEAVLDVRAILDGKNVALLKNSDTWTLDLEDIGSIAGGYAMAKSCTSGLDYKGYLGLLLLFQNDTDLALRGMNVQEAAVRAITGDVDFRMDSHIVWAEAEIIYRYSSLFPTFGLESWKGEWEYELYTSEEYGYW